MMRDQKALRVVMMITGKGLGGTKQAFLDTAVMLDDLGCDVTLVVRRHARLLQVIQETYPEWTEKVLCVDYWRWPHWPFVRGAVRQLRSIFEEQSADVIICHKPIDGLLSRLTEYGVPIVAVAHGFYKGASLRYLRSADHCVAVSHAVKTYLGAKPSCSVLPNAVNVSVKVVSSERTVPVLGTMCVFRRKKNIPLLLKACQRLKSQGVDFVLRIGGEGRQKFWLQFYAWLLGLEVEWVGWVTNKEKFFNEIDVFVVSSLTETFNICLIEAMSYQKPVVATRCGGPSEIVIDQQTGFLTPSGDAIVLADRLRELLIHPDLRRQMGQAGRRHVKESYSRDNVKKQWGMLLSEWVS